MMRFRWLVALAATSLLGLCGCMQTEDSTVLLADGSGTSSASLSIDLEKIKALTNMMKMMSGAQGADGEAPEMDLGKAFEAAFSEEMLREQVKDAPGVEIKALKAETVENKRVIKMDLAFADFASLGKAGMQSQGMSLKQNEDGSWTLTFDGAGDLMGGMGAGGEAGGEGAPQGMPQGMDMSALFGMLEPYLGTMSIERKVTVPGTVLSTNGKKSDDGKTVAWKFGFKDLTSPAEAGKGMGYMTVTFKGEGLSLKAFTHKSDPAQMQKRLQGAMKKGAVTPATPAPEGGKKGGEAPKPEDAPKSAPGASNDPVGTWVLDVDKAIEAAIAEAKKQLADLTEEQKKLAEGMMNPEALGAMLRATLGQMKVEVDLKADGSARMSVTTGPDQPAESVEGTWKRDGDKVHVTVTKKNGEAVGEDDKEEPGTFAMRDGLLYLEQEGAPAIALRRK